MEVQLSGKLAEDLASVLDSSAVLVGADMPERARTDWSSLPATAPSAVFRPSSTEEVALIPRSHKAAGVAVTRQGGITGQCGGAQPLDGGIALSMERMTGIEGIDRDGTVSAEHGIGPLKKPYLEHTRDQAPIKLMRSIKCCIDPAWTLTPTKIFN